MGVPDQRLLDGLLNEVSDEVERAWTKHGDECMASPAITDDGKRLGILAEEAGEAADEVGQDDLPGHHAASLLLGALGRVAKRTTYDNADEALLDEELKQLAAMATAWRYAIAARRAAAERARF
jgi:hypothetical protein